MKSIQRILPILLLFIVSNLMAQDEIYNEKRTKKQKKELVKQPQVEQEEQVSLDQYTTEMDYNQSKRTTVDPDAVNQNDDGYWDEEIYHDEDDRERNRDNRGGELAAQIIFDVVVNTVFIIATFWH